MSFFSRLSQTQVQPLFSVPFGVKYLSFLKFFKLRLFMRCMCVYVHMFLSVTYMPQHVCGSQRATCGSWFFPYTMWDPQVNLGQQVCQCLYLLASLFPLETRCQIRVSQPHFDYSVGLRFWVYVAAPQYHKTALRISIFWLNE